METTTALLQRIERFLSDTGMKASTFGRKAVKDPNFVYRLRDGKRRCWPHTEERVLNWMLTDGVKFARSSKKSEAPQ
jgi:2,4-dienoyl-CoA reductase-like NADH-dependent reductase (Old Yellow Enzyme family)